MLRNLCILLGLALLPALVAAQPAQTVTVGRGERGGTAGHRMLRKKGRRRSGASIAAARGQRGDAPIRRSPNRPRAKGGCAAR